MAYIQNNSQYLQNSGQYVTFPKYADKPYARQLVPQNITQTSATARCTINAFYLPTIIIFEYGFSATDFSVGSVVSAQSPLNGNINTTTYGYLTGLSPNTRYYYRARAENAMGLTYPTNIINFLTLT